MRARAGWVFVGTLRYSLPPARGTIREFEVAGD